MTVGKMGREPRVHLLFRLIASKTALATLEARRFEALGNREGVLPSGAPTESSEIEFYTEKDKRSLSTVRILDMEAKSAVNDSFMKTAGSVLFFLFVASSWGAGWFDEMRAKMLPKAAGTPWTGTAVVLMTFLVIGSTIALFGWKYVVFNSMSLKWDNALDSFFARNARAQMDAVRNCMVVFKRFLKWRRYMRLMMIVATFLFAGELALTVTGLPRALSATWSETETMFSILFVLGQAVWFVAYFYMWAFYTTYRDPTLQLCVLVNVMDRATVQTPTITDRR